MQAVRLRGRLPGAYCLFLTWDLTMLPGLAQNSCALRPFWKEVKLPARSRPTVEQWDFEVIRGWSVKQRPLVVHLQAAGVGWGWGWGTRTWSLLKRAYKGF